MYTVVSAPEPEAPASVSGTRQTARRGTWNRPRPLVHGPWRQNHKMQPQKTTAGVTNALEKLRSELRQWRFSGELHLAELAAGEPAGFLPLLHFILLRASAELAKWLTESGYELAAKSDLRFADAVYRLARQELNYNPLLTSKQFFTTGFAARKLQMVTELSARCRKKHADLVRANTMTHKTGPFIAAYQAGGADALATPRRSRSTAAASSQLRPQPRNSPG